MSQSQETVTPAATEPEKQKRKRRVGRPKSDEVAKEKVQTWFRCEPADKLDFKREAKRMGVPLRTWIKLTLKAAVVAAKSARREAA